MYKPQIELSSEFMNIERAIKKNIMKKNINDNVYGHNANNRGLLL